MTESMACESCRRRIDALESLTEELVRRVRLVENEAREQKRLGEDGRRRAREAEERDADAHLQLLLDACANSGRPPTSRLSEEDRQRIVRDSVKATYAAMREHPPMVGSRGPSYGEDIGGTPVWDPREPQ